MPTPAEVILKAAATYNDSNQQVITNTAAMPYLQMALNELQEIFELNNIPVTNRQSAVINCPAGTTSVSFNGPVKLPPDLVEIQQVWQSDEGQEAWTPLVKKEFLPHDLEGVEYNSFICWAWINDEIKLISSTSDIDLKLDYIATIFPVVTSGNLNVNLPFRNVESYLTYKTGALLARYIGENGERADSLEVKAEEALARSVGISNKGKQSIVTRRRPFRQAYKRLGWF